MSAALASALSPPPPLDEIINSQRGEHFPEKIYFESRAAQEICDGTFEAPIYKGRAWLLSHTPIHRADRLCVRLGVKMIGEPTSRYRRQERRLENIDNSDRAERLHATQSALRSFLETNHALLAQDYPQPAFAAEEK